VIHLKPTEFLSVAQEFEITNAADMYNSRFGHITTRQVEGRAKLVGTKNEKIELSVK
jgi:hypothetical protein